MFKNIESVKNIFNEFDDNIIIIDREYNIIFANKGLENMFSGKTPLAGKKCYKVYQEKAAPCTWCFLNSVVNLYSFISIIPLHKLKNFFSLLSIISFIKNYYNLLFNLICIINFIIY